MHAYVHMHVCTVAYVYCRLAPNKGSHKRRTADGGPKAAGTPCVSNSFMVGREMTNSKNTKSTNA